MIESTQQLASTVAWGVGISFVAIFILAFYMTQRSAYRRATRPIKDTLPGGGNL